MEDINNTNVTHDTQVIDTHPQPTEPTPLVSPALKPNNKIPKIIILVSILVLAIVISIVSLLAINNKQQTEEDMNQIETVENQNPVDEKLNKFRKGELNSISIDEIIELFSSGEFELDLKGVTQISPEVAKELSKFKGVVILDDVKQISPEATKELVSGDIGGIAIGLEDLSLEVTKELVKSEKLEVLSLPYVKVVSLETAKTLAGFKGETIAFSADADIKDIEKIIPQLIEADSPFIGLALYGIIFTNEAQIYNYLPNDELFQKIFGPKNNYHSFVDKREVYDDGTFLAFTVRYCCTTGGDHLTYLVKRNEDKSYTFLLTNEGQNTDMVYDVGEGEIKVGRNIDCQFLKDQGISSDAFKEYVEIIRENYSTMNYKSAKEICSEL